MSTNINGSPRKGRSDHIKGEVGVLAYKFLMSKRRLLKEDTSVYWMALEKTTL